MQYTGLSRGFVSLSFHPLSLYRVPLLSQKTECLSHFCARPAHRTLGSVCPAYAGLPASPYGVNVGRARLRVLCPAVVCVLRVPSSASTSLRTGLPVVSPYVASPSSPLHSFGPAFLCVFDNVNGRYCFDDVLNEI